MSIKYNGSNSLTYLLTLLNTKFGTKVDKVSGKGLSTNDLTNELKTKYDANEKNVIVGIQKNGTDLSVDSTTRKVNITVPTKTSDITNDSGYITQSQVPPGAVASTTTPKMDGTATVGTENAFARGDHVHPSDTTKVDKVTGKGLSTNDYTTEEKTKLSGIESGANKYTHPNAGPSGGKTSGLYKIAINAAGHVTSADAVAKSDITALGIPGSQPTVPTISTDITADATSDIKTASPKAVKVYVDGKVSTTYKAAGSVAFANLPATPSASLLGNVYNVTDAFTTDSRFVEGAGKTHPAGTNVVVIDAGSSTYKFDVLAGFVDLSSYLKDTDVVELTNTEVQAIWDNVFGS